MKRKNFIFFVCLLSVFSIGFLLFFQLNKAQAVDGIDISVEEITINNDEPDLFENVTFTVRVKNNGNTTFTEAQGFSNFSTSFAGFEQSFQSFEFPSPSNHLEPGEYIDYVFQGEFITLGDKKLTFNIDNENKVQEEDENNNSKSLTVSVQGYDLKADSVVVTPSSPAENQNCIITVKIKNAGTYNLFSSKGLSSYSYNIDNFQISNFKYTFPSYGNLIEPGEYMEYKFYGKFTKQGSQSVEFAVDTEEDMEEGLEDNNSITKNITVVDPYEVDLSVDSISFSRAKPIANQQMEIKVNIKNEGKVSILDQYGLRYDDVQIDFDEFIISERIHDTYPTLEEPFEPGDTYQFTLRGFFNIIGTHILSFLIDKNDILNDIDRTNNDNSETVTVYISEEAANEFQIIDYNIDYVSSSSVVISWRTDQETTGKLYYREDYYDSPLTTKSTTGEKENHEVEINGLKSGTTYLYQIEATKDDITKETQFKTFKTLENNSISITSGPRLYVNNTDRSIKSIWETNILTKGKMYYKKSSEEDYESSSLGDLNTYHNIEVIGLDPGNYDVYVYSESSGGTTKQSPIYKVSIKEEGEEGDNEVVYNEDYQSEETDYKQITNDDLYDNIKGKIILTVEANGEAYYVHPKNEEMFFLGRPNDAFGVMRSQGVGITNKDLEKIPVGLGNISGEDSDKDGLSDLIEDAFGTDKNNPDTDGDTFTDKEEIENGYNPNGAGTLNINSSFTSSQKGMIFLQVEQNGEAWYVNPADSKRYFLGRPADAFNVMRFLGLGISNDNFNSL